MSLSIVAAVAFALAPPPPETVDETDACTSIMVGRAATADGSTMITYSADAPFMPKLLRHEGGPKEEGATFDVVAWEDDGARGPIRQVARTYGVVGLMNDRQVAIGETTTGGRRELRNPDGLLDYDALIWLTLQRAATAREAIDVIDALCAEYGYRSGGETFAIADPDEVWVMELIGKGKGVNGIVWVAARVPDDALTVSANMSRITTFPTDDPENWRFADDVVEFAIEKGYFATGGAPFSFRDAYHPDASAISKRVCGARVWSIHRRACPSEEFPVDFHRGVEGAADGPLFVRPEKKLTVTDVLGLMRDHYEGTPYDMTRGVSAGPFGAPVRFRGLTFEVDGETYAWERPIATQQAGFVMLAQCRSWLPDPVGGVYWYAPDDPSTTPFAPLHCGITALPEAYATGRYDRFSWDSAWWIANLVSNLAYDRWSRVFPDVEAARDELEASALALLPAVDQAAAALHEKDEALARRFLTDWAVGNADRQFERWRDLATTLLTKHVDGYVKDEKGRGRGVGYPEEWLRRVVAEEGDRLRLPPEPKEETPSGSPDRSG